MYMVVTRASSMEVSHVETKYWGREDDDSSTYTYYILRGMKS